MGRKKRRNISIDHIDNYLTDIMREGLEENAFDANRDIFKLDIKRKKKESKLAFKKRQNRRMKKFVEKNLYINKDGNIIPIKLIAQQVILLADVFYKRRRNGKIANRIIIWAGRGGGKGVVVSILAFLLMVYRRRSIVDMAGAKEQAMVVYEYVKNFLTSCIDVVDQKLVIPKKMQMSSTELKNGVVLKCIANSPTQTRGKHPPVLIADEACQEDTGKDRNLIAAMNMVFSEMDFLVILLSTFHVPIGIFQDFWDNAKKKGFVKYKWDVYDTAQPCKLIYRCSFCEGTGDDCDFCKGKGKIDCKECLLTRKNEEFDLEGNHIGFTFEGCNGKCLTTDGYSPIENIFHARETNDDETWETEFECNRPLIRGPVYNLEAVWDCFDYENKFDGHPNFYDEATKSVGIDWGWSGQTSVIGPIIEFQDGVNLYREKYFHKAPVAEISSYLAELREEYGDFAVFADSSHPFENASLVEDGFALWFDKNRRDTESGVVFGKWKEFGIGNLRKWFDKRKIKISLDGCSELWEYLKIYKRDKDGKPIKKMDHGPDALMCAMLGHIYVEEEINPIVKTGKGARRTKRKKENVLTFGGKGDGRKQEDEEEV